MFVEVVTSLREMQQVGSAIGLQLRAGDLILLKGDLGAGKTTLTQSIALALGVEGVTSPTFVISKIYQAEIPLIHVDAYRLMGEPLAIFDDLDLDSRLGSSITIVEWGSGFVERLSEDYLEIEITFGGAEESRSLAFTLHGDRWNGFAL
jgi:tRNA threonylcarbamoyladenosine biosynthesis protein TsaE